MTTAELEHRVTALEREIDALRRMVQPNAAPNAWQSTVGAFADDPEFDEIVRLGAEYREHQRPDDAHAAAGH